MIIYCSECLKVDNVKVLGTIVIFAIHSYIPSVLVVSSWLQVARKLINIFGSMVIAIACLQCKRSICVHTVNADNNLFVIVLQKLQRGSNLIYKGRGRPRRCFSPMNEIPCIYVFWRWLCLLHTLLITSYSDFFIWFYFQRSLAAFFDFACFHYFTMLTEPSGITILRCFH